MKHDIDYITHIVVHHSATPPGWGWQQVHQLHYKKWKLYMGYHRLIQGNGSVIDGRRVQYRGAHVLGHNTGTLGICVLGWNEDNHITLSRGATRAGWTPDWEWTEAQHYSLQVELNYQALRHPEAIICGHRDLADNRPTLCPGLDISEWAAARGLTHLRLYGAE